MANVILHGDSYNPGHLVLSREGDDTFSIVMADADSIGKTSEAITIKKNPDNNYYVTHKEKSGPEAATTEVSYYQISDQGLFPQTELDKKSNRILEMLGNPFGTFKRFRETTKHDFHSADYQRKPIVPDRNN